MVKSWRRVGLVVNPSAGKDSAESLLSARKAMEKLGVQTVLTGQGHLGAAAMSGWPGEVQVHNTTDIPNREETRRLARWILAQDPDAVIVVGGDGTLSDVARVCIENGCRAPILGIGTGSTNVGRLITCTGPRSGELELEELELWSADCLFATVGNELLGPGFNDVVIGQTVVGTLDGARKDLDAAARLHGRAIAGTPRSIGNSATQVTRTAPGAHTIVAEGESVGTVITGFAEPVFFGKAVAGGVCLTTMAGLPAGCLVCDMPLAQVGLSVQYLLSAPPIVSKYVSLSEEINIVVEHVNDGAVLCIDGNPLQLLRESDRIVISVRNQAVVGVHSKKELRSA